jgi:hypothetical protein
LALSFKRNNFFYKQYMDKSFMIIVSIIITLAIFYWITNKNNNQEGGSPESESESVEESVTDKSSSESEQEHPDTSSGLDSTRNMQVVFPTKVLNHDGFLTEWKFNAGRFGIVNLQIYRKSEQKDMFSLVGENLFQVVKQGENSYKVPPMRQIPFQKGDVIGLRFQDLGIIKYVTAPSDVQIAIGNSAGVGVPMKFENKSPREYSIIPITVAIPRVNRKTLGGNKSNPASSAQAIIRESKSGYPVDGSYWIKTKIMTEPIEIYCNFSIRKGHGYMLIGSVAAKHSWLPIENGKFPFSPQLSFGQYDKFGRNGNYYLPWSNLDPSTVVDNDPNRCQFGKFVYNQSGKFCANTTDPDSRIRLPGGLTEMMFMTGNKKHWVVLNRKDIEKPVSAGRKNKIKPIDNSKNFEAGGEGKGKKCDPNANVYLLGNSSETWINMGAEHGCSNTMFWGTSGSKKNLDFKDNNNGIFIYVGGEYKSAKKSKFQHNPSYHIAHGKGSYKSTFKDAKAVCSSIGKRMCSIRQLNEANKDGYSQCNYGWTSTKDSKYKYKIAFPTNVEKWASLQHNKKQSTWCGKPGVNEGAPLRKDQVGADIYCCDRFEWSSDFDKLDMPYRLAKEWISNLEQQFERSYASIVPVGTKFIVFGKSGHGLSCQKTSDTRYELISHKLAVAHKKYPKIVSQIPPSGHSLDPRTIAIFIEDLPVQNIQKGEQWPKLDSNEKIVRYGSTLRLFNPDTKQYLSGSDSKYYHNGGSKHNQVVGTSKKGSYWLIKSIRGSGKIDANGMGDESHSFGKPIKNGKVIRLEMVYLKRNLNCNVIYKAPGLGSNMKEVSLFKIGSEGNSDDYWRVETVNGVKYWYVSDPVRFIHVNSGKVLVVPGTSHKTSKSGGSTVNTIAVDSSRGGNDKWNVMSANIKVTTVPQCINYLVDISKNNRLLESGAKGYGDLATKNKHLRKKYNNECYHMSKYSHDKVLAPELAKIASQTKIMDSEQSTFDGYLKQKDTENKRKLEKELIRNAKQSRLDELLSIRCKPVKKCVDSVIPYQSVNTECKVLVPLTIGKKVTDSLISEIKTIRRGSDNINNYDIRSHRDYFKFNKASDVDSC